MTLSNEEERRAWVAFAASIACTVASDEPSAAEQADDLLEAYRARLPATPAADGPDWSTAPDDAEIWVQEEEGEAFWGKYRDATSDPSDGSWEGIGDFIERGWIPYTGPYVYPGDWRDSKIRRPK